MGVIVMEKKRVLMVDHMLPGNTYTMELVDKLKKFADITLLCNRDYRIKVQGVTIKPELYNGGSAKVLSVIHYLYALCATIKELLFGNYDVVHIQTFKAYKYEIPLYSVCKAKGYTLVCTVHNVLPRETKNDLWSDNGKKVSEFYAKCDKLIVHNENCKRMLIENLGTEKSKIHVIPHGAYGLFFNEISENLNKKEKTFLSFGTIREYKGIDVLIRAIALIPEKIRENMTFIIAGKQNFKLDNTDYDGMIKQLNISSQVRFFNRRIEDSELHELFIKADACIFPYRAISGSGALLMAYSFGTPVIASNIPTFVEETEGGKTGLLFQALDPQALADAIEHFYHMEPNQIKQYKENIQLLVSNKYNWEKSAKLTAELYGGFQ